MLVLENLTAINVKIPLSEGVYRVGGLVGRVQNTNYTFKNCYYSGQFEMDMVYAGGLMGLATYDLGGMLGYSEKAASVKFENCQFNGNIAFNPDMGDSGLPVLMGAFIGRVNNGALTFDKCLASGQMNVSFNMDDPNMVSAFRMIAKQEGTTAITVTDSYSNLLVKDSYNSAIEVIVTGTEFTGATVEGAFVVAAKCGLAIDETAKTALSGFDFENVWTVNKGGFATLKAAAGDTYATEKASVKVSTFAGAHEYTTRSPYDDAQHKKSCACGAYVLENHTLINNSGAIAIEGNTEQHQTAYCLCGYKKLENHNLTLEKIDGNADQHKRSCDVCGFDVVENHDHATLVKVDDNQHKKVCICGDEIAELENHIWDDGVVTKEATHLAEGSKLFTCACGATKTEVIEKIAEHNYKNIAKDGDNADQHKKFCACGEFVMEDHAFDEGKVTKAATHMEEGVTTYTCVCKATKTEAIEKIAEHTYECEEIEDNAEQHQKVCECGDAIVEDHTWEEKSNTPATHLAAGEIVYGCDACGATKSEEIEKIAEHSFDNGTVTKEATHTAEGEKTYKCACGETETETIAKLTNHTYNIVTNHNDEQHKKSCECGEYVLTKHSFGKGTVTTEATETTDGVMTYKCSGCDATKTEVIPAKGTQNKPEEDKTTEQKPEEKPADNKQPEAPTSSRSGCFGVISSTTLVAFLTVGLGAALIRKKKED